MRRTTFVLGLLVVAGLALPAGAATYEPDAQLTTPTGVYVDAPGATGFGRIRARQARNYQFFAVNQGTSVDNITIDGCGHTPLARVRYEIAGPGVVTDAVAAGTYDFIGLPGNSGITIETRITARARAERGDRIRCRFDVYSAFGGTSDSVTMRFDVR